MTEIKSGLAENEQIAISGVSSNASLNGQNNGGRASSFDNTKQAQDQVRQIFRATGGGNGGGTPPLK